uniref:Uncharacterized protein n=1 Tax=Candidatus Kentrum sp. FM TaxID=2126340 RepID=A0A450SKF2_9GAMM|nr:MAG: hypothetical protein BECKFM1743C_GA0114222_101331 [Candidatus Kentron sp. FM]VFK10859.1 MAG: hypothetical protein BECKFM1743B_GA0114221_101581 [Candidatus Kentron sp. FM]
MSSETKDPGNIARDLIEKRRKGTDLRKILNEWKEEMGETAFNMFALSLILKTMTLSDIPLPERAELCRILSRMTPR